MAVTYADDDRSFLIRKCLCTCPVCGMPISGGDVFGNDLGKYPQKPISVTYCHHGSAGHLHAINMFIDANMGVRSVEKSDILRIVQDL